MNKITSFFRRLRYEVAIPLLLSATGVVLAIFSGIVACIALTIMLLATNILLTALLQREEP